MIFWRHQYDSSYYLFNVCKSGNKAAAKFLLEHGANINIKNLEGEGLVPLQKIPIAKAKTYLEIPLLVCTHYLVISKSHLLLQFVLLNNLNAL